MELPPPPSHSYPLPAPPLHPLPWLPVRGLTATAFLQVAHALGDAHTDAWTKVLADRLMSSSTLAVESSAALIMDLPHNLQLRLFHEALTRHAVAPETLLTTFPPPLHSSIVCAATAPDHTLHARFGVHPDLLLQALAGLDPPKPPSFDSLCLTNTAAPQLRLPTSTLLARVLAAHTHLSTVSLSGCLVGAQTLAVIAPALAALRPLRHLALTGPGSHGCVLPDALPLLAGTLRSLPSLETLSLAIFHPPEVPGEQPQVWTSPSARPPRPQSCMTSPHTWRW